MADSFNPGRLVLARRRRGLTKTALAKLVGVELRSVYGWESGEFEPDSENLRRLAKLLRFPIEFFSGADLETPTIHMASFRAMRRTTAALRESALGAGAIAFMLNAWIEQRFELPAPNVPHLGDDPETAADSLRQLWGLGELPIKNMVHLLESRGVRVYTLAIDATEVDAFSLWRGNTPFIFLNTKKSCEHSRFDAAHELGHLVLHRHGVPQGKDLEREANEFASAFLMPRASVLANSTKFPTIDHLVELKKYWTVSVAALAYRMHRVGILTDWHFRTLYIELSRRGYRKKEPNEAPREFSQLLAKVFASLREDGVGKDDVARALGLPADEITQLVFGLALTGVTGTNIPSAKGKRRAKLSLV